MSVQRESLFDKTDRVWAFDATRIPWQKDFLKSTAEEKLASGGYGSGKTRVLCEDVGIKLIAYPGNVGLLTRETHTSLVDSTLDELLNKVIPPDWIHPTPEEGHNKSRNLIHVQSPLYPTHWCRSCGWTTDQFIEDHKQRRCPECDEYALDKTPASRLYYKGLNTSGESGIPSNIRSMNLGFVAADEVSEMTESQWDALVGRLRLEDLGNPFVPKLPFRQIMGATNPASPSHWLHKRFYEQGVGEYWDSKTSDNPFNPDDYEERLRRRYTGTLEQRYLEGTWAGFEGNIYSEFEEAVHVLSPLDLPDFLGDGWTVKNREELLERGKERADPIGDPSDAREYLPARVVPPDGVPVVLSIDWGYRPDPTVVQFWARTSTHGYVLYRELFKTRTLPDQIAKETLDYAEPHEINNIAICYADHDSGQRQDWMAGARDWRDERQAEGDEEVPDIRRMQTNAAKKAWDEGRNAVKQRLDPDRNDRAELYFVRGARAHPPDRHLANADKATCTLTEMRHYSWKDSESDDPQEDEDHGMDAMRYMVLSEKKRGAGGGWETRVHKS